MNWTLEVVVVPVADGDDLGNVGFLHFTDPDGNAWAVQQITSRP
jgi:hypothetical protein